MKIHENPLVLLEFPFSRPQKSLRPKKSLVWGFKSQSCEIPMFLNLAPCRKSKFKKKNHVPCCLNPPIKNTCASSCLFKTLKKKRTVTFQKCCTYLSLFPVQLPIFIPNVCKNQPPTQKKTHIRFSFPHNFPVSRHN